MEPGVKDSLLCSDSAFISKLVLHVVFHDPYLLDHDKSNYLHTIVEMMKANRNLITHCSSIAKREFLQKSDISAWREQTAFVCIAQTVFRSESSVNFCSKMCASVVRKILKQGSRISEAELGKMVSKFVLNVGEVFEKQMLPPSIAAVLQAAYRACSDVRAVGLFLFIRFFCPYISHPDRVANVKVILQENFGVFEKLIIFF